MEFAQGQQLSQYMYQNLEKMTEDHVKGIIRQVVLAIRYKFIYSIFQKNRKCFSKGPFLWGFRTGTFT
jgi:hypothetical protein